MQRAAALILIASLLCIPFVTPVFGGQYGDAVDAYARGDYKTAYPLFKVLADQGNAEAQNSLGVMYENGLGIPQDYAEAIRWYRNAADQGYALAQNNLGAMYAQGKGVPRNYVLAHMWFSLAASLLPGIEREHMDMIVNNRDGVAAKMTLDQIAEAERLAREWKPKTGK